MIINIFMKTIFTEITWAFASRGDQLLVMFKKSYTFASAFCLEHREKCQKSITIQEWTWLRISVNLPNWFDWPAQMNNFQLTTWGYSLTLHKRRHQVLFSFFLIYLPTNYHEDKCIFPTGHYIGVLQQHTSYLTLLAPVRLKVQPSLLPEVGSTQLKTTCV